MAKNLYDSTTKANYDYEFVACGNFPADKKCNSPANTKPTSMCQEWNGGSANLGSFTSAIVTDAGITIQYNNGEEVNGVPRSVTLIMKCDQTVDGATLTSLNNVMGTFTYNAEGKSRHACPISPGGGLFIFLMILLGLVVVYIIVGVVLNKVGGKDEFHPHAELLTGIPGLVKDGALFIGSKTCCRS